MHRCFAIFWNIVLIFLILTWYHKKIGEPFFFLKWKVKKRQNVLIYNFYLILKFHKNQIHGNGTNLQNRIRKIRNLVYVQLKNKSDLFIYYHTFFLHFQFWLEKSFADLFAVPCEKAPLKPSLSIYKYLSISIYLSISKYLCLVYTKICFYPINFLLKWNEGNFKLKEIKQKIAQLRSTFLLK